MPFCLLCDLALEDALRVAELMELAKCIEFTPHSYILEKECGKHLSRGKGYKDVINYILRYDKMMSW